MSPRAHPCSLHRAVLLDWVDRRERGPRTAAALDHLERCTRCRAELEEAAVAIAALRRLGAQAAAATPPSGSWPRLRARVEAPRTPRSQIRAVLGGLVASAALVGIVVGGDHWQMRPAGEAASDVRTVGRVHDRGSTRDALHEKRLLDHSGQPVPADDHGDLSGAAASFIRWPGPDGLGRIESTVATTAPSRAK